MQRPAIETLVNFPLGSSRIGERLLLGQRSVGIEERIEPLGPFQIEPGQFNRRNLLAAEQR